MSVCTIDWTAWGTWALVAVTAVLAFYTYRLFRESVRARQGAFAALLYPEAGIGISWSETVQYSVPLKNHGLGVAVNVRWSFSDSGHVGRGETPIWEPGQRERAGVKFNEVDIPALNVDRVIHFELTYDDLSGKQRSLSADCEFSAGVPSGWYNIKRSDL